MVTGTPGDDAGDGRAPSCYHDQRLTGTERCWLAGIPSLTTTPHSART